MSFQIHFVSHEKGNSWSRIKGFGFKGFYLYRLHCQLVVVLVLTITTIIIIIILNLIIIIIMII